MSDQYSAAVKTSDEEISSSENGHTKKKSAGAFRTISEVAEILNVQQHVLRFWETKFTQVKPLKRGGGRRYYRPEDIEVLQNIHHLLYTDGYTIKGVQKLLRGQGKSQVASGEFKKEQSIQKNSDVKRPVASNPTLQEPETAQNKNGEPAEKLTDRQKTILNSMIGELKDLRDMVRKAGEETDHKDVDPE